MPDDTTTAVVEPRDGAPAPAPTPEPAAPAEEAVPQEQQPAAKTTIPDELLQVPAMQALMAGKPPAVSANIKEFQSNPVAKLVLANKDGLMKAGIGFYRSLSGDIGVIFNQFHMHPQELIQADKAGKLGIIAPTFDAVNQAVQTSGITNPALHAKSVPKAFKGAPISAPPQMNTPPPVTPGPTAARFSPVGPPPASSTRQLMSARLKNVAPGEPTSGAQPGAGRILNQILSPTV